MDYVNTQCPDNPGKVTQDCGDSVPCVFDYIMLNAEILANEAKDAWMSFNEDRHQAIRQCERLQRPLLFSPGWFQTTAVDR